MKLEVGMWVRLNCNYELGIGKIIREIDEDNFIKIKFKNDFECSIPTYMITKASHSLLGNDEEPCLIEVGDYVNGYKVADIDKGKYSVFIEEPKDYVWQCLWNNDIKSIVTKEQFESMSYKVGD